MSLLLLERRVYLSNDLLQLVGVHASISIVINHSVELVTCHLSLVEQLNELEETVFFERQLGVAPWRLVRLTSTVVGVTCVIEFLQGYSASAVLVQNCKKLLVITCFDFVFI